jgi:hypothetical protein
MPRSGTRNRSLPVSGSLGRALPSSGAARALLLEGSAAARVELGARVRLDAGELPPPAARTRAELVTYDGEVVTDLGEPVWILVPVAAA